MNISARSVILFNMALFKRLVCFCFSLAIVILYGSLSVALHGDFSTAYNAAGSVNLSTTVFDIMWGVIYVMIAALISENLVSGDTRITRFYIPLSAVLGIVAEICAFRFGLMLVSVIALVLTTLCFIRIGVQFIRKNAFMVVTSVVISLWFIFLSCITGYVALSVCK